MKMSASRLAGASALVLTLVLSASAAMAGNGKAALGNLPKDTAIVVSIDVDRVKTSPMFQDLLNLSKKNPDFAKTLDMLKAEASFDPAKDVHTIVVGLASDFTKNDDSGIFFMEGKFAEAKFLALAKKAGATSISTEKHRGVKYYVLDGKHEIAFLGKLMAAAPSGKMKEVIDVYRGKKPSVKKNATFMAKMKDTDTSKDFWMVMLMPDEAKKEMSAQLGGNTVDAVMAAVDIQKGVAAKLRLAASSVDGAKALVNLIQVGLASAGGAQELKALGLDGVVSRIKVNQAKANVDIAMDMTPAELAKLKATLGAFM